MEDLLEDFHSVFAIVFIIVVFSATFILILAPKPNDPVTTTTTEYFTGKLGMVSYQNSWFGLGGPDKTTLTFQNNTELIDFTFNKYLGVEIGKTYNVEYTVTTSISYNVPIVVNDTNPLNIFFWLARNTTKITPVTVVES